VSLIPLIIPREELVRVNRISSSLQELAAITGPALAGFALEVFVPAVVYAAIAVTGLASATLYRSLPKPRVGAIKIEEMDATLAQLTTK
jgi:hypothetical protein